MTTSKNCLKNPKCQLWQVICDGAPCVVEREIQFDSNASVATRSNKMSLSRHQLGEIIDLAVKLEKMGSEFYKKLARKTVNRKVRNLLQNLAAEEREHQTKLTELSKELSLCEAPETCREYFEYAASTVETHMLNGGDKIEAIVDTVESGLDIIKLATDFEKDTILFFNGFRNLIPEEKRSVIDDFIIQEQSHLVRLLKLRKDFIIQDNRPIISSRRSHKNIPAEKMPLVI